MRAADPTLRQLPRSLAPLIDESLPGYLLRLAHRLDLAPARLIELVGLPFNSSGGNRACIVGLSEAATSNLAWTTRLSDREVAQLTLISLADRYPPLGPTFLGRKGGIPAIMVENWLFLLSTRYCPQCLAGDGSIIQQRHGGPWRRTWRLPVTFCCLTHRRLLLHSCPQCRTPVHGRPGRRGSHRLVAHAGVSQLHPAQCRTLMLLTEATRPRKGKPFQACGFRLDQDHDVDTSTDARTLAHLLTVQEHLTDLLSPDGPTTTVSCGMPTTAASYFIDLRLVTELISASWPAARALAPTSSIADTIDQTIAEQRRQQIVVTQSNGSLRTCRALAHSKPPLDAIECGSLIATASHILSITDPATLAALISELFRHDTTENLLTRENVWRRSFLRARDTSSPGLRSAISGYARTQQPRPTGRPPQRNRDDTHGPSS